MRFDRRVLAFPLLLFLLLALFQYVRIDLSGVMAAGGVLFGEATAPLPIDAVLSTDKIDFQSRSESVSLEFYTNPSSIEVDSKPVKTLDDKSTLSISGFDGMFSIYGNGTVIIDGSAGSFSIGSVVFTRSKISGTLVSPKASFSGISSGMIDKKAKGVIVVGTAKTDFDGKIRITSFRGSVSLIDGAIGLNGNASRVSIDSGFKANFS
ncbi:MAG: hypothetical protein HZB68_02515 [Candidatus Aenigmarchaeota archaeon]|nr:hypothetical protein [Candidatus Aenigmarchaeota archaeon]